MNSNTQRGTVLSNSIFSTSIDFDTDGKQFGHIKIPHSRDEAGWGDLLIPIISIKNGVGPSVLLIGGNHGDEWEGQIALRKLAYQLDAGAVRGHIIVVPSLNLPATLNNSRCSPIDGKNMNRIFPGNPRGTITEKIASFITDELVQRVDCAVDLHAAGRNLGFKFCTMMHRYESAELSKATLELSKAFAVPISLVFDAEPDREGMLDTVVEDLGKPFISAELGSSGTATPESVAITERGINNVLIHLDIIDGQMQPCPEGTEIMAVPDNGFTVARDHGIFESFVELGDAVEAGQAVGQIHSVQRPDRQPIVHKSPGAGMVICRRTTGLTTDGDYLLAVAQPIDPGF